MNDNELKIMVPKGWNVNEEVLADGSRMLVIKPNTTTEDTTCHQLESIFKRVPASKLRLDDKFLKYRPKTMAERIFKEDIETAIKNGLQDFWCPIYAPSFDDNGCICYEPGKMPAVGMSYNWWSRMAKLFCPECGSRLGNRVKYTAFIAIIIKELVASGWKVDDAWSAVRNDSKKLGHYRNSQDAKHNFEPTGSREVCGWYDLGNCYKILAEDEETGGFLLAGGRYFGDSYNAPLASLHRCNYRDGDNDYGCGWLVFDRCPDC